MSQSKSLVKLAKRILEEAEKVEGGAVDEASARALFEATRELQTSVLTIPILLEDYQLNFQLLSCLGWLLRFKILNYVPTDLSPIAYTDLAEKAGVPVKRLQSVARMAMIDGLLCEPSPTEIAHTRLSVSLATDSSLQGWAFSIAAYHMPTACQFAEATARWPNSVAKNETAFSLALNTKLDLWGYMKANPEMEKTFSDYMRGTSQSGGGRLEHVISGFDWASLGKATIVDVGGSSGHASLALASAFPDLQFIVQDLPEVVQESRAALTRLANDPVTSRIRFAGHDFFTPQQPQEGGSAPDVYFLRRIIHDWPDAQAREILQHLAVAIQDGGNPHARILIMDIVMTPPGTLNRALESAVRVRDLTMAQFFNSRERGLDEWEQLVASTNPRLRLKSWKQPAGSYLAVMEVILDK